MEVNVFLGHRETICGIHFAVELRCCERTRGINPRLR